MNTVTSWLSLFQRILSSTMEKVPSFYRREFETLCRSPYTCMLAQKNMVKNDGLRHSSRRDASVRTLILRVKKKMLGKTKKIRKKGGIFAVHSGLISDREGK